MNNEEKLEKIFSIRKEIVGKYLGTPTSWGVINGLADKAITVLLASIKKDELLDFIGNNEIFNVRAGHIEELKKLTKKKIVFTILDDYDL